MSEPLKNNDGEVAKKLLAVIRKTKNKKMLVKLTAQYNMVKPKNPRGRPPAQVSTGSAFDSLPAKERVLHTIVLRAEQLIKEGTPKDIAVAQAISELTPEEQLICEED
jgi:hypothetical protein